MPKLVDIWRPDLPAATADDAPAPWLRRSLERLQRVLSLIHRRVENSAHLPGDPGGQVLYGGESLELRGGTPGPPSTTGTVRIEGSAFVFNEAGDDYDARFEGDTEPNLLVTNAGTDRVGVGIADPAVKFHVATAADNGTGGQIRASNSNDTGNLAAAALTAVADVAYVALISHGSGAASSRWGLVDLGAWCELLADTGDGLVVGTTGAKPVLIGTNSLERARVDSAGNVGLNASTFGTSAAKVVAVGAGTAPTSSPADVVQSWVAAAAAGDAQLYTRNEAGTVERHTGLVAYVANDFSATSNTTLADVTGLSINVEDDAVYAVYARLPYNCGVGGTKYTLSGTCTVALAQYHTSNRSDTSALLVELTPHTALDDIAFDTTSAAGVIQFEGLVIVNAGGTLTVQFAQRTSDAAASTLLAGGLFVLRRIA